MSAPSTLTITYTGGSGSPQTINLPKPDNSNPVDFTLQVRNIFKNGGVWLVVGGVNLFVPWGQITSITAQ